MKKFLKKAFKTYQEHLPDMMEFAEKVQERQQKAYESEQKELEKITEYKTQYACLSDNQLKGKLNTENRLEKRAIIALLQERNSERLKLKEIYSDLDAISLKIELKMLEQSATHYGDLQGHKLSKAEVDTRMMIVKSILHDRGMV